MKTQNYVTVDTLPAQANHVLNLLWECGGLVQTAAIQAALQKELFPDCTEQDVTELLNVLVTLDYAEKISQDGNIFYAALGWELAAEG